MLERRISRLPVPNCVNSNLLLKNGWTTEDEHYQESFIEKFEEIKNDVESGNPNRTVQRALGAQLEEKQRVLNEYQEDIEKEIAKGSLGYSK